MQLKKSKLKRLQWLRKKGTDFPEVAKGTDVTEVRRLLWLFLRYFRMCILTGHHFF